VENGSITIKDIAGWIVSVIISLVPLLIFYLNYRTDKKKSNKKILELEEMIYKLEIKTLKKKMKVKKNIKNYNSI